MIKGIIGAVIGDVAGSTREAKPVVSICLSRYLVSKS